MTDYRKKRKAIEVGAKGYLIKPIDDEVLMKSINALLLVPE